MSYSGYSHPQVGATFVPGGDDSYYLPEVIAPAPQRVLAEIHGGNMQDGLANMEQQAYQANARPVSSTYPQPQPDNTGRNSSYDHGIQKPNTHHSLNMYGKENRGPATSPAPLEQPNFSPFPVLRGLHPNIPPTDDEKERTLEAAREAVLASNDPETQLCWAQDVLAFVEIAQQNEQRISATQPPRSQTPRVEHMLREDAMKVVNFLADQQHPKAEFLRGMWLEFGKYGQRIDKKEAFLCYSRASEKGYARALYRIGMQFESSNDALKAIKYYQRGVDASDSASSYRLGMMTLLGQHGQPQDFERGLNLLFSAASTADENAPQGAYVFGMLQARELAQVSIPERFLPLDIPAARVNVEKAAYLGFAKAQVKMGSAYELCELGCAFDPTLSLHYNALAARQGESDAEMAISKWFLCGHEGVFEKNEEMAFTYAQRAAVGGLATAQFAMGYFYEVGIYVPVNFREAKEWYNRAAASGNTDAGKRIDAISRSKTLSRKDHESMALSKIRQQYGSQAQNPAQTVPALPTLPSLTPIDMPDVSRLSLNQNPYPLANAPYPNDLPGLPPHANSYSTPPLRPGSAFGINPNLRSDSATIGSGANLRQNIPYQGGPPPQNRPYTYNGAGGPGYAGGPGPAPYGRGGPLYSNGQGGRPSPSQPLPRMDIGYAAPLDVNSPDRRRPAVPRPNDPYASKPQPQAGTYQPRTSSRPNLQTQSSAGPDNSRYYPPSNNPRPNPAPPMRPANITPSRPNMGAPASSKPAKPNTVSASTASRPPGKGPKTFDQMGIPAQKNKSDCVMM